MEHEEEKGKLKEIKWQRSSGGESQKKSSKRKGKKRSEQRYGKGSMLF